MMTHVRNTDAIKRVAKKKAEDAHKRTDKAIKAMLKTGTKITFNSVAEKAGVSKAWLYKEADVAARIRRLRADQQDKVKIPVKASQRASDASKDKIIEALKLRIKKLERENKILTEQLQVAYGKLYEKDS